MKVRIALVQMPGSRLEDWAETVALAEDLLDQAARAGAGLALLPECVWPAYVFGAVDVYQRARQAGMPDYTFFLERLAQRARQHRMGICAGYVAEGPAGLANRAVLFGPDGRTLGEYDKCFLWDFDRALFKPGRRLEVFDSPWGPVGLMICADARLPEIPATLAARGARLILQPTAWVNVGTPDQPWNPQPDVLIPERARELGVPIASCSKCGREGHTQFMGSSIVCDADGNVVAQCPLEGTAVVLAEVEPREPRRPAVSPAQRARLLSSEPARRPAVDARPLRLVWTPRVERSLLDGLAADDRDATLVLTPVRTPLAGPDASPTVLDGPLPAPVTVGGAQVMALSADELRSFAPVRVWALAGVHVVLAFGSGVELRTLRCRAVENRVFVAGVTSGGMVVFDPAGRRLECAGSGLAEAALAVTVEAHQAADKYFAPGTNPFADRRVEMYEY